MTTGGYSEKLFFDLSKEEKEELACSICCHILRNPQQCRNGHQFCHLCITTWTYKSSQSACPMCRTQGLYEENLELRDRINKKIVHCEWDRCFWTGPAEHLETHMHTVYAERRKNDKYLSVRLNADKLRHNQHSRENERKIMKQNTIISQQIQKIELEYHSKFEKLYKRVLECELRRLKNIDKMRRQMHQRECEIREEDFRMALRIHNIDLRKRKEVEENEKRVKSLDIKREQFRETSLRKSLRQEREIVEENSFQKQRIDDIMKRKEAEKEKHIKHLKDVEKYKSERSQLFSRKLKRDGKEWNEKWEKLLTRVKEIERKKTVQGKPIQLDLQSNRGTSEYGKRPMSNLTNVKK